MASDGRDEQYERGLDDYHDPTRGVGGAPPARSALTLRLWLAGFGFVFFALVTLLTALEGITWLMVIAAVLAVIAAVDIVWVAHRKRRGEPG
jgi:hypothetical protein